MKQTALYALVLCLLFTACGPITVNLPVQASATASLPTKIPPTRTSLPATATITPTPTPVPPDLLGTPVFLPSEAISAENAARVTALASWGNGTLSTMVLSPDGKTLAVATSIGVVLYAADSLERIDSLPMDQSVNELAYMPDGQTLVLGLLTHVLLWNLPEHAITPFDLSAIEKLNRIASLATSPDGKWLAIGTEGRTSAFNYSNQIEGGTYIFDISTGKMAAFLQDPQGANLRAAGLVFSPDSQVLAIAESDDFRDARLILFWDTTTWQLQSRFDQEVAIKNSSAFAYSPDGKTLAFPSNWIALWLLNLADGTSVRPYAETDGYYFQSVAISPDGRTLASGGYYGLLTLWDTASGAPLHILQKRALPVMKLIFSPDGKKLYAGSTDGIRLWEISSGALIQSAINHASFGKVISFSPDGKRLATLLGDEIILWDAATGTRLQTFAGHNFAAISSDWSMLATVSIGDQRLWLYDLQSGRLIPTVDRGEHQSVDDMFFSPDGRVLAQVESGDDPQLLLWDTASGSLLRSIKGATSFLAFTPDGKTFATANAEITEPSPSPSPSPSTAPPTRWSSSGMVQRTLYVTLWDVSSGSKTEKVLVGGGDDNFYGLVFSPDGNSFVIQTQPLIGGITLSKWSLNGGSTGWSKLWTLDTESSSCPLDCPMILSPNGAVLALGSYGNPYITLVDVHNGTLLARLVGHNINEDSLADYTYSMEGQIFSPDGKQLVTSGEDGLLFFWGVRP
jgi:WD40 repeat protein